MTDKYDEQAEVLLPCPTPCPPDRDYRFHAADCPWRLRPVVAAALREMGERDIVRQTAIANLHAVIREKDAEIERLKLTTERLTSILASIRQWLKGGATIKAINPDGPVCEFDGEKFIGNMEIRYNIKEKP